MKKILLLLFILFTRMNLSAQWNSPVQVDNTGNSGEHTSLAIVNGNPAISYYNASNTALNFVRASNADGTAWNSPVQVDNSADVGEYTSLAIVNGNPAISYYDVTNGALYFVRASNADGTAWNSPVQVDNSANVGQYTSLAIVNGNPAISYYNFSNLALYFVRASNADGTAWNSPVQVDNSGDVGLYTSLAIVNGNPGISYYDVTNGALNFVRASNADGTAWNSPVQVDNSANVGRYTSLTIVNGNPGISYYDVSNTALNFVRASNADGTAWSCRNQVDNSAIVGTHTSLAIVNGNPAISYYDASNSALNFVRANINFGQGVVSLTVDDLGDASDTNIGDGACTTAGGGCTLRAALEEANALAILSSSGNPNVISINQSGTINIGSSLPNINGHLTLTGHSGGNTILDNGSLSNHVLQINAEACTSIATLSNLIFDGGDAGGIDIQNGSTTFSNCVFKNVSGSNEQAMKVSGDATSLTLNQCSFLDNTSNLHGGALEILAGTVTATNCTFSGNSNTGTGFTRRGGAVYMDSSNPVFNLINCTIVNNETGTGGGGGVFVRRGTLNLTNTIIANNTENNGSSTTDNDLEFQNHASVNLGTNITNLVENCEDNGATDCDNGFDSMADPNLSGIGTCSSNLLQSSFAPQSPSDALDNGTAPGGSVPSVDICGNTRVAPHDIGSFDAAASMFLPVELLSFKVQVKNNQSLLTWQTASEMNNQGFEIHWAVSSSQLAVGDWQSVGFVRGAGDSFEKQSYSFLHENPRAGVNYYRLKQKDFDGAVEYSNIVSVELAVSRELLAVSPNPAQNGSFILYLPENVSVLDDAETVKMTMYDYTGRVVRQMNLTQSQTEVNVADLEKGMYLIKAEIGREVSWARVVVQ